MSYPPGLDIGCPILAIPHTAYPISDFGIWESGFGKSDKLWREALRGLPHFAWESREHWMESLSSWCGRFPLDAEGHGAVGWVHRRMERWMKR